MRRYRGRPIFRVRRRLPSFAVPLFLTFVFSIGLFQYISAQLSPVIRTMAESKVKNLISQITAAAVDESLSSEQMTYKDFVIADLGPSGQVVSLSFRTADSAVFKRRVIESLISELELIRPDELSIPVGTLSGALLFSALGPSVRVRVQSLGDVSAEYRNEFTSAGVNQTRHSVYLDVFITVYLLIPGEIVSVSSCERICVAETIIVGDVPDTYLNFKNGVH